MSKHDSDRDGQGKPQPDKWDNYGSKDDGNKHGRGDDDKKKGK